MLFCNRFQGQTGEFDVWVLVCNGSDSVGVAGVESVTATGDGKVEFVGFADHTLAHVKENFSASWTPLEPERRERLIKLAATTPCPGYAWLEDGWRHA